MGGVRVKCRATRDKRRCISTVRAIAYNIAILHFFWGIEWLLVMLCFVGEFLWYFLALEFWLLWGHHRKPPKWAMHRILWDQTSTFSIWVNEQYKFSITYFESTQQKRGGIEEQDFQSSPFKFNSAPQVVPCLGGTASNCLVRKLRRLRGHPKFLQSLRSQSCVSKPVPCVFFKRQWTMNLQIQKSKNPGYNFIISHASFIFSSPRPDHVLARYVTHGPAGEPLDFRWGSWNLIMLNMLIEQ